MDTEFGKKLALALDMKITLPPCPVQELFNQYKKFLDGRIISTPVPEDVHLRAENFAYWIGLMNPNPADPRGEWIHAKAKAVIQQLEAGTFNMTGFRSDEKRMKALFNIPELLQTPNCIHVNLRNHECRGDGGIKGDRVYVRYYGKKQRKVGFTLFDEELGKVILVSSFWTYKKWVAKCAYMPAIYVRPGCTCTCK